MKKKLALVLSLVLCCAMLSGCTTLTALMGKQMANAATDDTSGDTVTISREEYEKYKQFDKLLELMDIVDEGYFEDYDKQSLLDGAADGLLSGLGDPYTFYYTPEEYAKLWEDDEGEYAGVGIQISTSYLTGICTISRVFDNGPAHEAGVRKGDILYKVEDLYVNSSTINDAVDIMRGTPGTDVHVTFLRGTEEMAYTLTRANINVNRIDSMMLTDEIGYIYLYDFAGDCAEKFETTVNKMVENGTKGLIIDLRGNGGGILQEAVKIVSMFVPKGTEVVRTKGRAATQENVFRTANDPILPDLPLAVLINGNSASAAEIVAGSLQDLDRAVLIGQKSFGKGLVQTTRPLGYNTLLKLTTAKYYIPSGRCIQAIDYSSRKQDGTVGKVADSLVREFTTRGGRKVYDGGGISPDIATEPQYISRFAVTLLAMGFIEDFVDEYMQEHHTDTIDNRTFSITDADYDAFVKFMEGKEVPYESETRRVLKVLKEAAENDLYSDLAQEITAIEGDLKDDTQTNLHTYRKEIAETINNDIVLRHSYQAGVIEHNLGDDTEVLRATEVLENPTEYQEITTMQTSEKK